MVNHQEDQGVTGEVCLEVGHQGDVGLSKLCNNCVVIVYAFLFVLSVNELTYLYNQVNDLDFLLSLFKKLLLNKIFLQIQIQILCFTEFVGDQSFVKEEGNVVTGKSTQFVRARTPWIFYSGHSNFSSPAEASLSFRFYLHLMS